MRKTALAVAIKGAGGGKGGKEQRAPVEAPDSLRSVAYARVLDLLSEGEVYGPANPDNPLSCIYFNETSVANEDGSLNFKNVSIDWRNGTQTQDYIRGFPGVENEIIANVELTVADPWVQTVTNLNLSAVRVRISTPTLSKQDTSNGDLKGSQVSFKIELKTDGGSFVPLVTDYFTGKTTSKYERSYRLDLPPAEEDWTIRITRLTPDSLSSALQNKTFVESYTEVIDGKFRMPMAALTGTMIDAEQFNSIPSRAYHWKGRIIQVPSNYDPVTREYSGVWDGTFQSQYSNNPAWVFYDMATNDRYGLGHLINVAAIDKWALYTIAQYCDEMVDDGDGGLEPRFTANIYLQSQGDATRVMQDLATMFRGIMYAAGGTIFAVADMPSDPVYLYNQGNVIDGRFNYSGSSKKVRYTVCVVSWNDMSDMGRAKNLYVQDKDGIARYGYQPTTAIAIGCTSRAQARRVARHILATSRLETDAVTWGVGLDGQVPAPGSVVEVADPLRAGKRMGGRIRSATTDSVVVDSIHPDTLVGDTLVVILPNATIAKHTIDALNFGTKTIGIAGAFASVPVSQSVWATESDELTTQKVRVLSVAERIGDDVIGYNIAGLRHIEDKFDYIDFEDPIVIPPTSTLGRDLPAAPDITITQFERYGHGTAFNVVSADWPNVANATEYVIQWQKDFGAWSGARRKSDSTDEWEGAFAGTYRCRAWGINAHGLPGALGYSDEIVVTDAHMPIVDLDIVSGVVTVDCRFSQFRLTLTENVTSVVFINVAPQDTILIEITQGSPVRTFAFGAEAGVVPVSGVAYVVTPVVGALDVLGLTTNNSGATWALVAQQPSDGSEGGGGTLSATLAPSPASDTVESDGSTSVAPSVQVVTTMVSGTAPYTHAWTRADTSGGTNFLIDDATSDSPTFSIAPGVTSYSATQTWRNTITDSATLTIQKSVAVTLVREVDQELVDDFAGGASEAHGIGMSGPSGGTALIRFYSNGTFDLWSSVTIDGVGYPGSVTATGEWFTETPIVGLGSDYEILATVLSGSGGTFTNGASSYAALSATRMFQLTYTRNTMGSHTVTRVLQVTIREIGNPSNSVTGTMTLQVTGENS